MNLGNKKLTQQDLHSKPYHDNLTLLHLEWKFTSVKVSSKPYHDNLTMLHSERSKLHRVLAILSAIWSKTREQTIEPPHLNLSCVQIEFHLNIISFLPLSIAQTEIPTEHLYQMQKKKVQGLAFQKTRATRGMLLRELDYTHTLNPRT